MSTRITYESPIIEFNIKGIITNIVLEYYWDFIDEKIVRIDIRNIDNNDTNSDMYYIMNFGFNNMKNSLKICYEILKTKHNKTKYMNKNVKRWQWIIRYLGDSAFYETELYYTKNEIQKQSKQDRFKVYEKILSTERLYWR